MFFNTEGGARIVIYASYAQLLYVPNSTVFILDRLWEARGASDEGRSSREEMQMSTELMNI